MRASITIATVEDDYQCFIASNDTNGICSLYRCGYHEADLEQIWQWNPKNAHKNYTIISRIHQILWVTHGTTNGDGHGARGNGNGNGNGNSSVSNISDRKNNWLMVAHDYGIMRTLTRSNPIVISAHMSPLVHMHILNK
jgi:hypothetical protein